MDRRRSTVFLSTHATPRYDALTADPSPAAAEDDPQTDPSRASAFAPAGWLRIDSDNVIRGWATDRRDRSARQKIDLYIDDERVVRLTASRPDAKLLSLNEGDGRYAFAYCPPDVWRDGRAHRFKARVEDMDFVLRSKAPTFEIPALAAAPKITLTEAKLDSLSGVLSGGQYTKSTTLELWVDGELLDLELETHWRTAGPDVLQFTVPLPPEVLLYRSRGGVSIAAPGMVEAGLRAADIPAVDLNLKAEVDREGVLLLEVWGETPLASGTPAQVRLSQTDERATVLEEAVAFVEGRAAVKLPHALVSVGLDAMLLVRGVTAPSLKAPVKRTLGRLARNGALTRWSPEGPSEWAVGEGVEAERSFYAFPTAFAREHNVAGHVVRLRLPQRDDEHVILHQPLSTKLSAADLLELSCLLRGSGGATLRLRLLGAGGATLAETSIGLERAWIWSLAGGPQDHPGGEVTAIELVALPGPPIEIEVAGIGAGAPGFADVDLESVTSAQEPPANLVANADLERWPHGLRRRDIVGRAEIAEGWFALNRRSREPVMARPAFSNDRPDEVGLALGAERIAEGCRLEVRVDPRAQFAERLFLTFELGMPALARELFSKATTPLAEFVSLERILLVSRRVVQTGAEQSIVDETVATLARRVLISRSMQPFSFQVAVKPKDEIVDLRQAAPPESISAAELYLILEFREPFAVALRRLSLTEAAPSDLLEPPPAPFLALEDRNIAEQATHLVGLSDWVGRTVVHPGAEKDGGGLHPMTWRWSTSSVSVEVVICVYNAVEETLACLRSLHGASEVPHTVRIIDDGSSPTTFERLAQFAVDKPWISIHRNAENRGYTYSADKGIRESEAEWVVLLNSDTVVTRGWLEGLLEVAQADPEIAAVGPVSNAATFQSVPDLYDAKNQWKTNALPIGWTPEDVAAVVRQASRKDFPGVPLLNGFCTLIRRSAFLEVGGLNTGAFPAGYGEENDLCLRLGKAGHRLVVADHVYVYHSKSASFGQARRAELAKAGGVALRTLHPDVDITALTTSFRETPALTALRAALRAAYDRHL